MARCRRLLGTRKIGHSGTLDPGATGVLLVGVGSVTRLLRFLGLLPKTYEAEVVLGSATTTLDADGEVVGSWDMSGVTADAVADAALRFVGDIRQVPPMVSAVSVGGRRLHELARAGVVVDREARPVTVHRLEVEPTSDPRVYRLSVDCSTGTYVRVLAADLGEALGGGAHLRALRRTAVGQFIEAEAVALDDVGPKALLPPVAAVAHLPSARVGAAVEDQVGHGRILALDALGVETGSTDPPGPWAVVDEGGRLLAVYEAHGPGRAKPAVVLPPVP